MELNNTIIFKPGIVYLMGKTKTLPEDVLKKIKEDMERNKLEYSSLQFELNDNCPN